MIDRRTTARCQGFTLIEVLLVIVIAAAGASLVGGALFRTYDTVRIEAEESKVIEVLQNVSWRAFLRNEPGIVNMKKKGIEVCGESTLNLTYIDFGEKGSTIVFDVNGFPDTHLLVYRRKGRFAEIDLDQALEYGLPQDRAGDL